MSALRTALLTGGTRGIGASIAALLRRQGTEVVAPTRAEMDLAQPASIERFLAGISPRHFDLLINNAGVNNIGNLEDVDAAGWRLMYQVNLAAPFRLLQAVVPAMKAAGWGRIVNISSIWSLVAREKRATYATMKAGLNGLTRAAAVELGPSGILVNAVCPGYVATELTRQNNTPAELERIAAGIPLRRLAEPAEVARLVAFLCSADNTYITGQLLVIDGGYTCI